MCSKQEGRFLVFFEAIGNLLFSLLSYFSITKKYVFSILHLMLCTKKVCSKQAGSCFLVYYALFLIKKMCVHYYTPNVFLRKARNYFCNMKNVCSKQVESCF